MAESSVARVDGSGRLLSADARLLGLQQRAGAGLGEGLAVPPLASMARLARTLGILVSRSVVIAEGDHDLDVWVRARPDGDAVILSVGGWTVRPQRAPWLMPLANEQAAAPQSKTERWTWATDGALRLTALSYGGADLIGQPLTRIVRLIEDDQGDLPIIGAVAGRTDVVDQRAIHRDRPDEEIMLSATALIAEDGRLIGFDGQATGSEPPVIDHEPDFPVDTAFGARLDKALRTPLSRIVANADLIRAQSDGPLRRDYANYAGDIASAARHLLALVDDLGDLQTVEQPEFRIETEPVDLADIARRAAGLLQVRAADKQVKIDRPASDETLAARGEFRRVLQIVVNLIGNAVRYSPEGSMIWLRTERDADTAVLIVADQGKGIDRDDQRRIFEKFERVDPAESVGSGLGLYISRRLARAMGGDIAVDSAPGQGARFVLTLPVA